MHEFLQWIIGEAIRLLYIPLRLFPIKRNRVIINSYGGRQYSCNPKSISDYLIENEPGKYEIIWAFRNKRKYSFLEKAGIKIVPYASLQRIFYESTAKVSVVGTAFWAPLRKGQAHINTWHGGGAYKAVGLEEARKNWFAAANYKNSSQRTSLFLSSSRYFSKAELVKGFDYHGEILECGMPRNDLLVHCSQEVWRVNHEKICQKFRIAAEDDIILYAPTWRYDSDKKIQEFNISQLLNAYHKRFGRKAILMYRAHHMTTAPHMKDIIDVTSYPDMQELLLACDMLISDYSSCIWDFSFTYKPCILYTPDLQKYRRERGFIKDISEWHFPYYEDNESLIQGIENFDEEKFVAGMKQHHEELGSCETGEATKIVCERIHDICFGNGGTGG